MNARHEKTLRRTVSTALLTVIVSILPGAVSSTRAAEAPNVCDWTGLWAPGGTLAAKRDGATATTLQDGRVLVVGGYDGANTVGFAELYNPGTASAISAAIPRWPSSRSPGIAAR